MGVNANLELLDKFCYLGDVYCWVWMEMLMQNADYVV